MAVYMREMKEGQVWGRLLFLETRVPGMTFIWCRCLCGRKKQFVIKNLLKGRTNSCGCATGTVYSHGHSGSGKRPSATYRTWQAMKTRCYNPNQAHYKYYGAMGVEVCERWRSSFQNFLDDMGERPEGLTLDRVDPHGDYEPGNCRWATSQEQALNRRNSIKNR